MGVFILLRHPCIEMSLCTLYTRGVVSTPSNCMLTQNTYFCIKPRWTFTATTISQIEKYGWWKTIPDQSLKLCVVTLARCFGPGGNKSKVFNIATSDKIVISRNVTYTIGVVQNLKQYLQCVSTGDVTVLYKAMDIYIMWKLSATIYRCLFLNGNYI